MTKETIEYIKNTPYIYDFLREESYHYKYLYRDDNYLKTIERLAKEKYKLTLKDKLERLNNSLNLINTFIDVMD